MSSASYILYNQKQQIQEKIKYLEYQRKILKDWYKKYKTEIIGFETFVFGENRTGSIYKADNWNFVGMSKGASKRTIGHCEFGEKNQHRTVMVEPKLIYCKKI